jgi:hypothetical protein
MRGLSKAFEKVAEQSARSIVFNGLTSPTLIIWTEAEVDASSKKAMLAFAAENKVEIVSLAPDHADRAWQRYFNVAPPFNPDQPREQRRKDIPDSWILETAIDLKKRHPDMFALCGDHNLSTALTSIPIRVFEDARQVLDEIEIASKPELPERTEETDEAVPSQGKDMEAVKENQLEVVLAGVQDRFKTLDAKILGYVSYLGSPSKDQLFGLLSREGVPAEIARNVAERLAIAGIITDTGNHYLSGNKEAGELAAALVEPDIIKLLEQD